MKKYKLNLSVNLSRLLSYKSQPRFLLYWVTQWRLHISNTGLKCKEKLVSLSMLCSTKEFLTNTAAHPIVPKANAKDAVYRNLLVGK
mmetsp:Transcript_17151/g.19817  ORF Transcript_17151/g.19817 Transcript_17151/m.19817 type:complete len:87 (+) Transcript_17151:382-642(+)